MSQWAKTRKRTIQFFLFSVLLSIGSLFVFFTYFQTPSCTDGIQNRDEEGVDCGGSCINQCVTRAKQIDVLWSRVFKRAPSIYSAVAIVESQNTFAIAKDALFEFTFFDSEGALVGRKTKRVDIQPNRKTPVFISSVNTGKSIIERSSVRLAEEIQFIGHQTPLIFSILDFQLFEDNGSPRARATVGNLSNYTARDVFFIGVVFDEGNNAVAASSTFVEKLLPNEKKNINFTWVNPFTLNIGLCDGLDCVLKPVRLEIYPLVDF